MPWLEVLAILQLKSETNSSNNTKKKILQLQSPAAVTILIFFCFSKLDI